MGEAATPILILGGAGVFGRRLAAELLAMTAAPLILAGRDAGRAAAAAAALDQSAGHGSTLAPPGAGRVRSLAVDARDPGALAAAVASAGAGAVCACAGPFAHLPRALPAAVVGAGAHWLDIADDPDWVIGLLDDRRLDAAARAAGRLVVPGLSSVPAISGILARRCLELAGRGPAPSGPASFGAASAGPVSPGSASAGPAPSGPAPSGPVPSASSGPAEPGAAGGPRRLRITLFIGNRNAKGTGSVASTLAWAGRPLPGGGTGWRRPVPVDLPPPIGRRPAYPVGGPDPLLLPRELGLGAEFRCALDLPPAGRLFAALAPFLRRLGPGGLRRAARLLTLAALPVAGAGTDLGALQAELLDPGGRTVASACLSGRGQRLPVLPCAIVAAALPGSSPASGMAGCRSPGALLSVGDWLGALTAAGLDLAERL